MRTDIREALRSLRAAPGFTAVVTLTLALAVGITAALFSVLYGVLLRPLDYAQPDRLVALFESSERLGQPEAEVALATWLDWRAWNRSLAGLGVWRYRGFTLTGDGDPERVASVEVTPSVFDVLGVLTAAGILSQWVQALLFGVSAIDVVTYLSAGLALVAMGAVAAAVPALRASRIDPVRAIRER